MNSVLRTFFPLLLFGLGVTSSVSVHDARAADSGSRVGTINQRIVPKWSDPDHFTFSRETEAGDAETVSVDASSGELKVVDNAALPKPTGLSGDPVPRSGSNDIETELEFVNETKETVELLWVDSSGERRGYEKIAPGRSYRQHTYAGHSWEVVDAAGKYYGGIVASAQKSSIKIEKTFPRPRAGRQRRGPGSRPSPPSNDQYEVRISDGKFQLRSLKPVSDQWDTLSIDPELLDSTGSLVMPQVSPDGRVAVVWAKTPGDQHEVFTIESSPQGGGRAKLQRRQYPLPGDAMDQFQLIAFETETGKPLSMEMPVIDFGYPKIRWRRGHQILIEKVDRGHQRFRLFAIDPLKESVQTPIDESTETFIWTAHGPNISMVTYLNNDEEIVYASEKSGWRHLYLVNLDQDGSMQPITSGSWLVREIENIDQENRVLDLVVGGYHAGQDPYHKHYVRVDFSGENLVALTQSDGDHEAQFSPDRKYVVVSHGRVDSPPVHELRRTSDGELIAELMKATRIGPEDKLPRLPTVFSAKGRDGETDIWGMIHFPPDYDPASDKKYPVIEAIYAGPHDSHVPKRYSSNQWNADLTSLGFIVVRIDAMGTANRSKAFHDVCWHNLKDAGFPDRIAWMQAAAEQHPAMDLERVGIYGTSAGGQNACGALLFHGDFYKAAMAACGCHDNRMDKASWNEQWMGYPVGSHYAASSNIEHAANLEGDLLLILGELDSNVPPESTFRLVDALIRADKNFDFVMVPGLGHGDGGSYGRRRTREFFVEKLKPDAAPTQKPNESAASQLLKRLEKLRMSSPWDSISNRYAVDRDLLMRRFPIDIAPQRIAQLDQFFSAWQTTLQSQDPSSLSETDQELYSELADRITSDQKKLTDDRQRSAEILAAGEFVAEIIELCDQSHRGRSIDHQAVASQLSAVVSKLPATDEPESESKRDPSPKHKRVRSAIQLTKEFDSWRRFYADYDPMFDWWIADTASELSARLKTWAGRVDTESSSESVAADVSSSPRDIPAMFDEGYPDLQVYQQRPAAMMPEIIAVYQAEARKRRIGSDKNLTEQASFLRTWNQLVSQPKIENEMFDQWSRSDQIDFFLLRAEIEYQNELIQWRQTHKPLIAKANDGSGIEGSVVGRERLMLELKREFIGDTPEKLIELAERGYEECRRAMVATAGEMGFGEDWQAAVEKIKTLHEKPGEQPVLIRRTAEESIDWLREHDWLTIDRLAESTWRMEMMSPERQLVNPFFTGGEVISVSFPTRQMSVDAQSQSLRGNNQPFVRATVHHELIPGHHWQFYQTSRYQTHRRRFSTPFWLEGWAVYWEFILERNGFVQTPEERLGFLVWRAHRYARIIFSLRFHLGQFSPDQCVDFLVENVGFDRLGAEAEVRRSVGPHYPPLYQAGYMLGAMQLQQLAGQWAEKNGDLKPFHDAVTREGNLPIALLQAIISEDELSGSSPPSWQFDE